MKCKKIIASEIIGCEIHTDNLSVVPVTGLEPVRYCYLGILSPVRLPISPYRQISNKYIIPYLKNKFNRLIIKY